MILRAEGLTKTFDVGFRRRKVTAVEALDLEVNEGEIFGFVGPNGAGKTTTIKMLMGLIYPTRGRAFLFDDPIPSRRARARLGYLPENPAYYEFLTGREALRFFARLAQVPAELRDRRCDELLEQVGLAPAADRQIRKYSKGMQQRLGLAQALVGDPALVVLDEPMSGLDPVGRKEVRDVILDLRRRGKTVFFSTHILPDVEMLCDRVGVILHGRLRDVGRIDDLLSGNVRAVELSAIVPAAARARLQGGQLLREDGERLTLSFADEQAAAAAVEAVVRAGGRVLSLTPYRDTLEDFFVRRLAEAHPEASSGPARAAS
jgi:ABC-2 type transport system ATP-binding protein